MIAQAISAVLCMWRLMRMTDIFDFRPKYLKMKKQYSMEIIRLGLPSGITQAIFLHGDGYRTVADQQLR